MQHTWVSQEKSENGRSSTPRKRSRWPTIKSAGSTEESHIILEMTSSAVRMRGFLHPETERYLFVNVKSEWMVKCLCIIKSINKPSFSVSICCFSAWVFFPFFWVLLCFSVTTVSSSSECVVWGMSSTLWSQERAMHYLSTKLQWTFPRPNKFHIFYGNYKTLPTAV